MYVPAQIKTAAQSLIDVYGSSFDYLGNYEGKDAYAFHFPEDADAGFPFVYLFDNGKVQEVTGFDALDVMNLFFKD